MGMSEFYGGTQSEAGPIKTLHTAINLVVNHSDTADMYGAGHNEALVSNAFSDRWDKVTMLPKFGVRRGATVNGRAYPAFIRFRPKNAAERQRNRAWVSTPGLLYLFSSKERENAC